MKTFFLLPAVLLIAFLSLTGCQTSPDQAGLAASPGAGEETDLRLVVKDDSTCLEMRAALKADAGNDSLRAAFLASCVEEVPPFHPLPPRPLPFPALRCEWAGAAIDSGRVGLIPAYVRHCAAVCDSLALSDSAAHAARCVLPPRVKPVDSLRPPRDTANHPVHPPLPPRRAALCDSLRTVLDGLDSTSADRPRLAHQVAAVCKLPPPRPKRKP